MQKEIFLKISINFEQIIAQYILNKIFFQNDVMSRVSNKLDIIIQIMLIILIIVMRNSIYHFKLHLMINKSFHAILQGQSVQHLCKHQGKLPLN